MTASQAVHAGSIPVPRLNFKSVVFMKNILFGVSLSVLIFIFNGCVAVPVEEDIVTDPSAPYTEPDRVGVYHKVKKGETVWRIAKVYNVSIADIIRSNNIPDVAQVEQNQLVFIPGVQNVKEIVIESERENGQEDFGWPLRGQIIRYYKSKDGGHVNKGIDIKASVGEVVKAARSGQVVFADHLPGYGHTVIVDHRDGYHTVYAQNGELLVKLEDIVKKSQPVAIVGKRKNDEAYLHFEIRRQTQEDNPLFYLP